MEGRRVRSAAADKCVEFVCVSPSLGNSSWSDVVKAVPCGLGSGLRDGDTIAFVIDVLQVSRRSRISERALQTGGKPFGSIWQATPHLG